jgi:hypothetical protein
MSFSGVGIDVGDATPPTILGLARVTTTPGDLDAFNAGFLEYSVGVVVLRIRAGDIRGMVVDGGRPVGWAINIPGPGLIFGGTP